MGTGSFPGVKSGRGVTLTPHPLLVPWSRKGRAKPLLPLWAVRPVQSLSAYARVQHVKPRVKLHLYCWVINWHQRPQYLKTTIKTQDLLYWEVREIRWQGLRVLPKFLVPYFEIELCCVVQLALAHSLLQTHVNHSTLHADSLSYC